MIADSNLSALERLVETWIAELSATEFKVAAYLYYRLAQAGPDGLSLRTEDLAAATGVGQRTVDSVRHVLAEKRIIELKSAPGETSHYAFPGGEEKKGPDGSPGSVETQATESIDSTNHPDSVEALVERMTDTKPDSSYLQELQKAAGSPQTLKECLQWMVDQSKYSFGFSPEMPHLLVTAVSHLCHGEDSEFLWSKRKPTSQLRR